METLPDETRALLAEVGESAANALAENLVAVDVRERLPFVDAFVFATADNSRHLRAVASAITHDVRDKLGRSPKNVEGDNESTWLLIDYADVAVHIFLEDARDFYALDKLWADAPRIEVGG